MDILSLTPPLPEDFLQLCEDLFPWVAYLFVWKNEFGRKTAFCTECNAEMNIDIRDMKTVAPADRVLYTKRHNELCNCPSCGAPLIYKDRNRGRGKLCEENYLYYFQALPDGGMVLRTFYLHKSFELSIENVKVAYSEHQRIYFYQGNRYRFKRYPKGGVPYFAFCDWYNADVAESKFVWLPIKTIDTPHPWTGRFYNSFPGSVMWAAHKDVFKGDFKYACLKEYLNDGSNRLYYESPIFQVVRYLERFQKNPSLVEKMAKQGFMEIMWNPYWLKARNGVFNWNKPDVYTATGLNKGIIRQIGKRDVKKLFQCQLTEVYGVTRKNAEYILLNDVHNNQDITDWARTIKNEDIDSINRLIKYYRKQHITWFGDYYNYLHQLEQLHMPIEENRYPHDFQAAHEALTVEINRRANAGKRAAARREQKKFEKAYQKLENQLHYEDESFIIRPARGDEELLEESNVLSHCVYSCYRNRYKRLETIICVIRQKEAPDKPFYTLEIKPDYTLILQCRGKGNCGTTPEVEVFKRKWFEWLQTQHKEEQKPCRKTA